MNAEVTVEPESPRSSESDDRVSVLVLLLYTAIIVALAHTAGDRLQAQVLEDAAAHEAAQVGQPGAP